MKKPTSPFFEREEVVIHITGKLKDMLVRRACRSGHNFSPEIFLIAYLSKLWRVPFKHNVKKK